MLQERLASLFVGSKLAVTARLVRILYVLVLAVSAYRVYSNASLLRQGPEVADLLAKGPASKYWQAACEGPDPAPVCAAPAAARRLSSVRLVDLVGDFDLRAFL